MIEPEPQSGVRNMALDEALLEAALERGQCTVRWYRWNSATVSLGYFQKSEAAAAIPRLNGLPVVRRLTGGGAILHHLEWTYSCAVPPDHPLAQTPLQIYERVHERIIAALAERGVSSALRGTSLSGAEGAFLCFGRGDPRDVVLEGQKIVGQRQRRRRGAVLQHGSLLFRRSEYAPNFRAFSIWLPGPCSMTDLSLTWANRRERSSADSLRSESHDRLVEERVTLLEPRYRTLEWGRRLSNGA